MRTVQLDTRAAFSLLGEEMLEEVFRKRWRHLTCEQDSGNQRLLVSRMLCLLFAQWGLFQGHGLDTDVGWGHRCGLSPVKHSLYTFQTLGAGAGIYSSCFCPPWTSLSDELPHSPALGKLPPSCLEWPASFFSHSRPLRTGSWFVNPQDHFSFSWTKRNSVPVQPATPTFLSLALVLRKPLLPFSHHLFLAPRTCLSPPSTNKQTRAKNF